MRLFLAVSLLLALGCHAACLDTASTQRAIEDCTNPEKLDRELNRRYQALMKKHAENAALKERIRKSQRAWLAWRDLELEIVPSEGSAAGMCRNTRLGLLLQDRIRDLAALQENGEGDACAP